MTSKTWIASVIQPQGNHGWTPCIEWCRQNLSSDNDWRFVSEGVFEFVNEQDYTLFLLRWR